MVDAAVSKTAEVTLVWVRVPSPVPLFLEESFLQENPVARSPKQQWRHKATFYVILLIVLIAGYFAYDPVVALLPAPPVQQPTDVDGPYRVMYVVDGDTIAIDVKGEREYVRFLQINAPEVGDPGANEATAALETLIRGGKKRGKLKDVYLEYGKDLRDVYGRRLAYVWCDGKNLNLELVALDVVEPYFKYGRGAYYRQMIKLDKD